MERLTGSYVHRGLCYDGDECRQRKRENQVFNSHRNGIGSPTACRMPTDAFRRDAQHEQVEGACARVPDLYNDALSVMDIRFRLFTLLNRFILCLEVLVTDFCIEYSFFGEITARSECSTGSVFAQKVIRRSALFALSLAQSYLNFSKRNARLPSYFLDHWHCDLTV